MATIIPIPAFRDNYIWLVVSGGNAAVVDPGDAVPVLAALRERRLTLTAILNTHHHGDHVGGNAALLEHRRVPVFGPARENIPGRTDALAEGDRVSIPGVGLSLAVLDVPGHTSGHIAYVGARTDGGPPVAFVGDTLFAAGCGRVFEGTAEDMTTSLAKISALDAATQIYCAHEYTLSNLRFASAVEPNNEALRARVLREQHKRELGEPTVPSTLADEWATNPFLRSSHPDVRAMAQARAGHELANDAEVFAVIRGWKDQF